MESLLRLLVQIQRLMMSVITMMMKIMMMMMPLLVNGRMLTMKTVGCMLMTVSINLICKDECLLMSVILLMKKTFFLPHRLLEL